MDGIERRIAALERRQEQQEAYLGTLRLAVARLASGQPAEEIETLLRSWGEDMLTHDDPAEAAKWRLRSEAALAISAEISAAIGFRRALAPPGPSEG